MLRIYDITRGGASGGKLKIAPFSHTISEGQKQPFTYTTAYSGDV